MVASHVWTPLRWCWGPLLRWWWGPSVAVVLGARSALTAPKTDGATRRGASAAQSAIGRQEPAGTGAGRRGGGIAFDFLPAPAPRRRGEARPRRNQTRRAAQSFERACVTSHSGSRWKIEDRGATRPTARSICAGNRRSLARPRRTARRVSSRPGRARGAEGGGGSRPTPGLAAAARPGVPQRLLPAARRRARRRLLRERHPFASAERRGAFPGPPDPKPPLPNRLFRLSRRPAETPPALRRLPRPAEFPADTAACRRQQSRRPPDSLVFARRPGGVAQGRRRNRPASPARGPPLCGRGRLLSAITQQRKHSTVQALNSAITQQRNYSTAQLLNSASTRQRKYSTAQRLAEPCAAWLRSAARGAAPVAAPPHAHARRAGPARAGGLFKAAGRLGEA